MNRNVLKIFVAVLAVGLVLLSYGTYQQQQQIDSLIELSSG